MSFILQVLIFIHKNSNELVFNQSEKTAIKLSQPKKYHLPRPISQMNHKFSLVINAGVIRRTFEAKFARTIWSEMVGEVNRLLTQTALI